LQSKIRLFIRMLRILLFSSQIAIRYRIHYFLCLFYSEETQKRTRARLHKREGARIRRNALALKGVLIKLGQFLSARGDILPKEFLEELSDLQDAVPPADIHEILERIHHELGEPPEEIFARFDPTPIASASLGQVHEAFLSSGERVAVKVQYPGIHEIVEMDLKVTAWILRWLAWAYPRIRWNLLYDEFANLLRQELDYVAEGHNAEKFRKNFEDDERILVPKVMWNYTTSHVLTLEYLEGIKISDFPAIRKMGVSLPELARLLVESYIKQILQHRFLHGDPHPGNLFVLPGPKLIYVDFGLMQPLTSNVREGIRITVGGIIQRDINRIVQGLTRLGFIAYQEDQGSIERVAAFFIEKYRDISPRALQRIGLQEITQDMEQIFSVTSAIQIPNNFILLWRTAGILNGINSKLDPDLNIIEIAKPYALPFIQEDEKGVFDYLLTSGREAAQSLLVLPRQLENFLNIAMNGNFATKMSSEDLTGAINRIYRLGYRSVLGFFTFALWGSSIFFEQYGYQTEAIISKTFAVGLFLMFAISLFRPAKS